MKHQFWARWVALFVCGVTGRGETTPAPAANESGLHDFDFQVGEWRVHHRVKRPSGEWYEFEGTCSNRPLMNGRANVEDNTFHKPGGDAQGVALRTYDSKSGQWAIWWVDSRDPHGVIDPPVKGVFQNGVGQFYSDSVLNGQMTRTRYTWSQITPTTAHWEQGFSKDGGQTWDTNWTMEFTRVVPR
jgi:hypothetical protein